MTQVIKNYKLNSYGVKDEKRFQTVYENEERELFIKENNSKIDKYYQFYMFDFVVKGKSGKETVYKFQKKSLKIFFKR